jgi:hypothetical protein
VATYKRDRNWGRARGSISEIADIARLAREAVESIPHADGEGPNFGITVEMPGIEDTFTSEAEFKARVLDYPLSRLVVTVNALNGWKAESKGGIVLYFGSDSPGARMYVHGSDRRWVDGTAAIIRDAVDGVAVWPRSRWYRPAAFGLAIGAEAVALQSYWGSWTAHPTAVAAGAGAVFALAVTYLFGSLGLLGRRVLPKFRLVRDDAEDPSARRLRLVKRVAGTAFVLVVGAVISALVNKWIR